MTPWLLRKSLGCWRSGLGECHIYMLCMCRARLSMMGGSWLGRVGSCRSALLSLHWGRGWSSWAVSWDPGLWGEGCWGGWAGALRKEFSLLWGVSGWVWGRTWQRVGQLWPGTAALPSLSELGWHWRSFRTPPLSTAPRRWFCSLHWPHWNTMLDSTPFSEVTYSSQLPTGKIFMVYSWIACSF